MSSSMTKSDKERIAVLEAMLSEHVKSSDTFRVEVKWMLTTHENRDQERTVSLTKDLESKSRDILKKIEDIENKFDSTYVQRREVWAISSFVGFLVTLIGLTKIFITKQP